MIHDDTIRLLVVEDEPMIAENIISQLTDSSFTAKWLAIDYDEAIHHLEKGKPDMALLDVNLSEEKDGIDIAGYIKKTLNIPFVFLTSYSDKPTLDRAKATEPYGYVVKPFHKNTLMATLEIAWSNYQQQHNQHVPVLNRATLNKHVAPAVLSQREFDVLQAIYAGKSNQEVAASLFISINTLKRHINNAYMKLEVANRGAALAKMRDIMLAM